MKDYFIPHLIFGASKFYRCFIMKRELFSTIMQAVVGHNQYFVQKGDVIGRLGLSLERKLASVFRQLVYGCPTYSKNAYTRCG